MNPKRMKQAPDWLVVAVERGIAYAWERKAEIKRMEDHCRLVADYIFTQSGTQAHDWEEAAKALQLALDFLMAETEETPVQVAKTIKQALDKVRWQKEHS